MKKSVKPNKAGLLKGTKQIGDFIGQSNATAWRWIKYEGLPVVLLNGCFCTTEAAVNGWLANRLRSA